MATVGSELVKGRSAVEVSKNVPAGNETKNAHRLFIAGLAASTTYVVGMSVYAWRVWGNMLHMSPDEFATFLSGVFAPLAFLWLVLGFRQQGDELQNSARALWLQGEELRNSVEQQRQLVEVTREQLSAEYAARVREEEEADRVAQPQLLLTGVGGSYSGPKRTLTPQLSNAGPTCTDMQVIIDGVIMTSANLFPEGASMPLRFEYNSPEEVQPLSVMVKYTDRRGNRRSQSFEVPVDETGSPYKDRTLGSAIKLPGVQQSA